MSKIKSDIGAIASAIVMVALSIVLSSQSANADIANGIPNVAFEFGGQSFNIQRGVNGTQSLPDRYSKTTRTCPENCIEPGIAAPGVRTLTELEVFAFMQQSVSAGVGLLVDTRLPEQFHNGSIPAAISVPAATLVSNNPYREDLLLALGATGTIGQMNFSGAFDLLVFDDGPWSPTARQAVQLLLEAGYPAEKILYYRGGLQMWHIFGLTVSE
mgnify:CR=1 FL=1